MRLQAPMAKVEFRAARHLTTLQTPYTAMCASVYTAPEGKFDNDEEAFFVLAIELLDYIAADSNAIHQNVLQLIIPRYDLSEDFIMEACRHLTDMFRLDRIEVDLHANPTEIHLMIYMVPSRDRSYVECAEASAAVAAASEDSMDEIVASFTAAAERAYAAAERAFADRSAATAAALDATDRALAASKAFAAADYGSAEFVDAFSRHHAAHAAVMNAFAASRAASIAAVAAAELASIAADAADAAVERANEIAAAEAIEARFDRCGVDSDDEDDEHLDDLSDEEPAADEELLDDDEIPIDEAAENQVIDVDWD